MRPPLIPAKPNPERQRLKVQLATTYADFAAPPGIGRVSDDVIEKTRHWLDEYAAARDVYASAANKYGAGVFTRNLLAPRQPKASSITAESGQPTVLANPAMSVIPVIGPRAARP